MRAPRQVVRLAVGAGVLAVLAAAAWQARGTASEAASTRGSLLTLHPCRPRGVSEDVRCGALEVPEDRASPRGRQISLHVAVVPALSGTPKPDPVFVLAGGPGQGAAELIGAVLPMLRKVHRTRDLVFVDQRGTGKSSPLACDDPPDAGLAARFAPGVDVANLKTCLARYQAKGIDVRQYLTPQAMDDLDAVRAALGYDQIDLWGVSYGTRAALVYMRRHPKHVRAAVLDSVAPNTESLVLTASEDADRAFELIFDACAKSASCDAAYPRLRTQFTALLDALAAHPAQVRVADPVTGAPVSFTLGRDAFVNNLHGLLYVPEISALLPLIIHRAAQGDYGPFVAQAAGTSGEFGDLAWGMFLSVVCAEDAPVATPQAIAAHTDHTLMGAAFADDLVRSCAVWPRGALPPGYHHLVRSSAPTLLLSGELDPVTPPARAAEIMPGLTHSLQLTVPGVGHGVTQQGCVPDLVAQFIDTARVSGLDGGCAQTLRRPPFFASFAGPPP